MRKNSGREYHFITKGSSLAGISRVMRKGNTANVKHHLWFSVKTFSVSLLYGLHAVLAFDKLSLQH